MKTVAGAGTNRGEVSMVIPAEQYHVIVEHSPVMIWRSGLDAKCDYFNDTWLRFTGRTLAQEVGDGWSEGVHRDDFDRCLAIYLAHFERREPFEMEYRLRRHDGVHRYIFDRGVPNYDDTGNFAGFIGSCVDVHDRRTAEEAKERYVRAEAANEAKDEFLGILSHELRAPLHAMLGWLRLLQRGVSDEATRRRALRVLDENISLQIYLVDELLDVSRIVSGKLQLDRSLINLGQLVQLCVDTQRVTAEKGQLTLAYSSPSDDGLFVLGDDKRLQEVVGNLLSNAIKFTPPTGRVEVHLEHHGDSACVTVRDTGTGISAALLPHVFERFRQTEGRPGRQGGLGLGLSIVKQLVEQHGGTVEARSEGSGMGSVFTVTLPLARASSEPERTREFRRGERTA
jgi:PAS domain S-box-containing protein